MNPVLTAAARSQTQRDQLGRRGNPPAQGVELWTGCAQVVEPVDQRRAPQPAGSAHLWDCDGRIEARIRAGSLQGRSEVIGLDAGRLRRRATSEQRREDDSGPLPHRCARPRLAGLALARVSRCMHCDRSGRISTIDRWSRHVIWAEWCFGKSGPAAARPRWCARCGLSSRRIPMPIRLTM